MMVSYDVTDIFKAPYDTTVEGNTASFVCGQNDVNQLVLPKSAKIVKLEKKALPSTGPGRYLALDQPLSLSQALEKVKGLLELDHLRIAVAVNASLGKYVLLKIHISYVCLAQWV